MQPSRELLELWEFMPEAERVASIARYNASPQLQVLLNRVSQATDKELDRIIYTLELIVREAQITEGVENA